MAAQGGAPFVAQSASSVTALLRNLETHTTRNKEKKSFSCKKSAFPIAGSRDGIVVDSWRFQDWDYKRDDLPTYARGLFTIEEKTGNQPEIAIRGYDKFFNTDEVSTTKWENIEKNTKGPYELSLKENGCIIFISGLSDGSLLVCSKHSTGPRSDTEVSHAIAGERWVDRQLQALGKTREDLARELRKRNATAVAELCDDAFEEHILAYGKDIAGLYLHGINLNLPQFATYPGSEVQAFADEWGFRRTNFLVLDDIQTVKHFLESVGETGHYEGRDVEGFVIRCQARDDGTDIYRDWFFKYKFEEPYLMYRQWRECTKALIAGKPPKYKKHVKITEEYLLYARKRLSVDAGLGKDYSQNHGIIGLRDDFLKEKNLKGSDIIRQQYALEGPSPQDTDKDIILVPVATIGCGKTTIAIALQHLFDWGHVQNDNITGKNRPPRFTAAVLEGLEHHPVVLADRNNAQRRERKQIIDDVHKIQPGTKLVALHFVHTHRTQGQIREVTQGRVFSRGDNHQTIQAASKKDTVVGIMEGFIKRFEPVRADADPDDGFDAIIDLNPALDSRVNLETVIGQLHTLYPKLIKEMPESEELDDAITFALNEYRPDLKHDVSLAHRNPRDNKPARQQQQPQSKAPKKRALEYFAVSVPTNEILKYLQTVFDSQSSDTSAFWTQLKQTKRVQDEFHVTLIHRASTAANKELWERYSQLHEQAGPEGQMGSCQVMLEKVVWDDRVMAVVVRLGTCDCSVRQIVLGSSHIFRSFCAMRSAYCS